MAGDTPRGDAETSAANASEQPNAQTPAPQGHGKATHRALILGAIGVVFGDIGTSPIYALREAIGHAQKGVGGELAIIGVVSLAFWALMVVVTFKYVMFLMRADNKGEGGTLSLMALAQHAVGRRSAWLFILGVCGAALFYSDGVITPAISVLSAVEGLKDAPGLNGELDPFILPISAGILVALFMVQSRGTAGLAKFFGPITAVWFLSLGVLGLTHIFDDLSILRALSPIYGIELLLKDGFLGFVILGSVFLAVTGAEALYADMGHFGKAPIRQGWLFVVLPCLTLNYLGQGAFLLDNPGAADNPFWNMVPQMIYWPMLILATAATVIASQAVITGAFSVTQQAVQLGLLPRIDIRNTSETLAGQIYVPAVNSLLMIGVLFLLLTFQSSHNLTAAYGVAVTGTMLVNTLMSWSVVTKKWKWPMWAVLGTLVPFGIIDGVFLTSNLLKIPDGAWMPLVLGGGLVLIMWTWVRGTQILTEKTRKDSLPLHDLIEMLKARPPHRAPGTAIFLTSDPEVAPVALMHNLKHNKVLHEKNVILTVHTADRPRVADSHRVTMEPISDDFKRLTITYGFMETPNVPRALGLCRKQGLKFDIMSTSFFLGRRSVVPSARQGMPLWQDKLFIFLMRNAANPTDFFHIPPGRVVELGTQVSV
ncbi:MULTISPECIES: potassium transporter Kup [unclassified Brevundimonas]|uniref:potassium transporter Kup n=1 Tax=unclassified Brevundimonas TaxID=2622653 RepID=UPI000CFD771E|nr:MULTISPECIES: potassium transporter Kup [unclassified Brevundimonas]PRA36626.1 potassium transporter Kup [Brevundimonas sp. MYb27]PQZ78475.1 potassium transporter Kup [Brevundimonas sp. MYb31]PRB13514.1 potassium transporter Kup [Brevundimonas sp. MYb52]PRB34270.1 potassium transporter Kup [Brevundimonas sp. MYb46]PRB43147.1 potassium transporter Kup [Brevundimonas sp. MYb33]